MSAEGAKAQSTRLEVIANNLANIDTVGFKRELAIFQARYAEDIDQGYVMPGMGHQEDLGGGIFVRETTTDFSTGPMKRTNNPQDVAIEGKGFFVVRKGEDTFLTRAGNFAVNTKNELTTAQGYQVLGESGQPIILSTEDKNFSITDDGQLYQRGSTQKIAMVDVESLQSLEKTGENLFRTDAATTPLLDNQRRVASGFLEASTVKPTVEMTSMIEASRMFEANVNMMRTQDSLLGTLIGRLLKV